MPPEPRPVLVADDDPVVRGLVALVLGRAGYAVTAVPDGAQALALLTDPSRSFAAAVLDRGMPGLTGPQVLARVRPTQPTLPVLVVSGDADATTIRSVRADPCAEFLAKPFLPAALARAVDDLVGQTS